MEEEKIKNKISDKMRERESWMNDAREHTLLDDILSGNFCKRHEKQLSDPDNKLLKTILLLMLAFIEDIASYRLTIEQQDEREKIKKLIERL